MKRIFFALLLVSIQSQANDIKPTFYSDSQMISELTGKYSFEKGCNVVELLLERKELSETQANAVMDACIRLGVK